MKTKQVALIDAKLLMKSEELLRRAQRERKFHVKRSRRIEATAWVYNLLVCGLIDDYESFLAFNNRILENRILEEQ